MLLPDWFAVNDALPVAIPDVDILNVPSLTVGIVGKVTKVPAPVIYCAVVPPGAKACV